MNIKGKIALITGASRGIGRAIAYELAKKGIRRLILVARNANQLHQVADSIRHLGVEAVPVALDLTIPADVSIVMAKAWRDYGDIDLLINCAGVAYQTPFLKACSRQVQVEMATNMMGMYTVTSSIARRMVSRRSGTIVNVSSLMGKVAAPTMATYSATKFAIVGFTRALRMELAPHNVKVLTLLPSLTDTDMAKEMQTFKGVISMSAEQVAEAFVQGLSQNDSEILVGWQSHLAVWCDRFAPRLLELVLKVTAPKLAALNRPTPS
ncbi:MAG: SDR family NAD(P)-dependent oxidoreductase [Cyanobacteria bacterium J06621_11]